jgi:hypothetical protein
MGTNRNEGMKMAIVATIAPFRPLILISIKVTDGKNGAGVNVIAIYI